MNVLYEKLIELIGLNKGVLLGDSKLHDTFFRVQFCVSDSKTRLLIHFVAEASNTNLNTYAKIHPCDLAPGMDPDAQLVYEYISNSEELKDQVCWLGAHLTWAMFKMGVINAGKEQEFCKCFGAVSRSA
jgi:hypothetical protein